MKNEIVRLGLILCIITVIASGTLAFVNQATYPVIQEQIRVANDNARKQIIPTADNFELVEGDFGPDVQEVYKATSGTETVGYIIKNAPSGYGGPIELMVGVLNDGTIAGAVIGTHAETPGLGAKAKDEPFISKYIGKSIENPLVVAKVPTGADNEIAAISGATITSDAVTLGVNQAVEVYKTKLK